MEMKFCQSCGMPLTNEILGTNADGTPNEDYCIYCYKDGKFTRLCGVGADRRLRLDYPYRRAGRADCQASCLLERLCRMPPAMVSNI